MIFVRHPVREKNCSENDRDPPPRCGGSMFFFHRRGDWRQDERWADCETWQARITGLETHLRLSIRPDRRMHQIFLSSVHRCPFSLHRQPNQRARIHLLHIRMNSSFIPHPRRDRFFEAYFYCLLGRCRFPPPPISPDCALLIPRPYPTSTPGTDRICVLHVCGREAKGMGGTTALWVRLLQIILSGRGLPAPQSTVSKERSRFRVFTAFTHSPLIPSCASIINVPFFLFRLSLFCKHLFCRGLHRVFMCCQRGTCHWRREGLPLQSQLFSHAFYSFFHACGFSIDDHCLK